MNYKPLPIGADLFAVFKKKGYYYVDKTLFIKDLIDKKGEVNLFTRPRRFGKTLNINMLKCFFEEGADPALFEGLKIMEAGEKYISHMGQYPVIWLTLKGTKFNKSEESFAAFKKLLAKEVRRIDEKYLIGKLKEEERAEIDKLRLGNAENIEYSDCLQFLCQCLKKATGKNTIILIDEYDVPLESSFFNGYYNEMVNFMCNLFESAFKTNDCLEFAVLTGCLRVSKESIFTGLNNLEINSILTRDYGEYFGFTEEEVKQMLRDYGLECKYEEVKEWYDGYIFGETNVYNPWSTLMYVKNHISNPDMLPLSYWANTSSNSIVRDLIVRAKKDTVEEIEQLIQGGSIEKQIHEDITYKEIYDNSDNLWNFMFFTGYLKKTGEKQEEGGEKIYATLVIPNRETRYIYSEKIRTWFDEKVQEADRSVLFNAMFSGDEAALELELNKFLRPAISCFDSYESFYHGFLLGVLASAEDFRTVSNREAGDGRSDILVEPTDIFANACVIELKVAERPKLMEEAALAAIRQIDENRYYEALEEEGYSNIQKIGISFFKKNCKVKCEFMRLD